MDEYIKRTDLEDWLCRICDDVETDSGYVMSRVDEIPVAKVREDITGEWIVKTDGDGRTCGECTACGAIQFAGLTNFCHNCGARMTSQREDGDGT